jgi:hypothetical protein
MDKGSVSPAASEGKLKESSQLMRVSTHVSNVEYDHGERIAWSHWMSADGKLFISYFRVSALQWYAMRTETE